ncbi:hypothetical protein EZV62_023029 [Acer yangbiense]|uniref:Tubby C-terminal domain-containing protein n=1 Tax=Acer yangbiense TaxID=1000413 RepID=A0A5C7H165_9ROSI|nr:hypothetical protein EZV62_023029 [Acer yangbiense]
MAKVHPLPSSYSSSSSYVTSKREAFTIWMKSLVMNGNGCTVFNENGDIVYRIDNYEKKGSREVYLMDLRGKVLFTLRKVHFFKRWECYKGDSGSNSNNKQKPVFQVTKNGHITFLQSHNANFYKLEAFGGNCKSALTKIVDNQGGVVAEAKRKQSSSSGNSVVLGDDVLTLVVDAHVDHSLVVALFTVYGLIQRML